MVGDVLDWVRVFGRGLKMGDGGCTWVGNELELSRSGLNMSGSG